MWLLFLITVYCVLLIIASLVGGYLPSMMRVTHTRMQLMMSFVGGLMMGVALLHLLPHAVLEANSLDYAAWSSVLGLLAMFLTIRVFEVHHHAPDGACLHQEQRQDGHALASESGGTSHPLSWVGLFIGLGIHSIIDGVAVGASVAAAAEHSTAARLLGIGTFLAVLLHKPLDSLSVTSVMLAGNWSNRARNLVNFFFALICPLGALLFYLGIQELGDGQHLVVGCALGFSAGVFLCISLADILPEIQFHRHDRVKLFAALLLGVLLAFAIGIFEPEHAHDLPSSGHAHSGDTHSPETHAEDPHAGHNH
jgi:zinc and cadmium transporter